MLLYFFRGPLYSCRVWGFLERWSYSHCGFSLGSSRTVWALNTQKLGSSLRHMGVVCCQAQTKGGHILIVVTPSLSRMTPAGYRDPSAAPCVPCPDLVPVGKYGATHSQLWGSFCLCHLKWLLCFLSFLFFFSCAYKYILQCCVFLIRVEEKGVIACAVSTSGSFWWFKAMNFQERTEHLSVQ